jgi:outer membrane receptor for ferrienterochelin and colicin
MKHITLAALGAVLVGVPASGEDAAIALPPVEAVAPPEASPAGSLERQEPTSARTVLEVEPYRGEAKDTAALIAGAPGVQIRDAGGSGQAKTVSLRGAAPNAVWVLLDGVPLGGTGNAVDLATPEARPLGTEWAALRGR